MKKVLLSIFLILVLSAAVYSQESMDQRVAIVNLSKSEIISRKQLDQTIKVLQHAGVNKSEQEVLEVMVEDVLLRQGAEKEGIQVSEAEVLSAIRKEVGAGANVSDEQLKDFVEQRMNVSWAVYADRSKTFKYKITQGDLCYRLFKQHGFRWGGEWKTMKDYQHFER